MLRPARISDLRVDQAPPEVEPAGRDRSLPGRRALAATGLALAALAGAGWWLHARQFEDTDNAQIDGDISNLGPRVAGTIKAVHIVDHQRVRAGQLLAEIDPADLQVAVAQARAAVAQAQAQLQAEDPTVPITQTTNQAALASSASDLAAAQALTAEARRTVDQLSAELVEAEANDRTAQAERRRAEILNETRAIAAAEADRTVHAAEASAASAQALRHALDAARQRALALGAKVTMARSRVDEVRANGPRQLESRRAAVLGRQAALDLARAQLAQAELNLGYTQLRAPADGIVGKKSINPGDRVAPGQQVMAIAQVDGLWVTANFRETQLRRMHPGMPVEVYVDALATTLPGTITSIGGATGSRFSVLPPENATGNYVKVVQRIPVRIHLDAPPAALQRLRPGMSVVAKVRVR